MPDHYENVSIPDSLAVSPHVCFEGFGPGTLSVPEIAKWFARIRNRWSVQARTLSANKGPNRTSWLPLETLAYPHQGSCRANSWDGRCRDNHAAASRAT